MTEPEELLGIEQGMQQLKELFGEDAEDLISSVKLKPEHFEMFYRFSKEQLHAFREREQGMLEALFDLLKKKKITQKDMALELSAFLAREYDRWKAGQGGRNDEV